MTSKSFIALLLGLAAMAGCHGKVGTLRNIPTKQQQEVLTILRTGPYDIHECSGAVIIEPKNRDASLEIIGSNCRTREEGGGPEDVPFNPYSNLQEIVDPEGHVLGYVYYNLQRTTVGVSGGDNGGWRLYISTRHSGR